MTAYSWLYIQVIAENLRRQLGLPAISPETIRDMFMDEYPLPVMARNGKGVLWLDKYYAAFMLADGCVRYVYLSRPHILEEYAVYKQQGGMPKYISRQFAKALRFMRSSNADVWLETRDYKTMAQDKLN